MFVPDDYRVPDPAWALDLVRRHPLALLVSPGADGPLATHLPAIPVAESLDHGTGDTGLTGTTFLGHLNRRNPHWAALDGDVPSLLVFSGPDAYVSPLSYGVPVATPTWNFTSVHLRGTVDRLGDDQRIEVIKATVAAYERDHGGGWDPTDSLVYFEKIAPGAGAFRFTVTGAEAMFKLSQDKPPSIRQKVLDAFAGDPSPRAQEIAGTMCRMNLGVRP